MYLNQWCTHGGWLGALPPDRIEIAEQIKRLKNHKTPGEDGIQAEILKSLDEETISNIHNLVELVWK